jgi:membrane protease YdiL (CAAX protease family)
VNPLTPRTETNSDSRWLRPELIAPWWEVALVLAVMLGPFAYSSTRFALASHTYDFIGQMVSTHALVRLIALQAGLLAAFFFYLKWRGWTPSDFKIRINLLGTLVAPALAVAAALVNGMVAMIIKVSVVLAAPHPHGLAPALMADAPRLLPHSIDASWVAILVASVVNAYIEELVFMGYAFNQFAARRSVLAAMFGMVFLRMLLHTYKGPVDMLGIAAFSFVYGIAYWQLRRLWPLICAHALTDAVAFALLKLLFGR